VTASADISAAGEICGIHFKNNEEGWCHVVDEDDHGDRTLNRVSYKNGFSLLSHASLSFLVPNLLGRILVWPQEDTRHLQSLNP